MKVVIAVDNASMRMSGETAIPLYFFDRFRRRGIDVWMVCHERCRRELEERYPADVLERIRFVPDTRLQVAVYRGTKWMPFRFRDLIVNQVLSWLTDLAAKPWIREMIDREGVEVVFQPTPIASKAVSMMYGLGVPVVIGPMYGGMEFPPAFQSLESWPNRLSTIVGRPMAELANRLLPGKLRADVLLVANERTRAALPKGCTGVVHEVVESGVDLDLWKPREDAAQPMGGPTRFVYMARFVDQKGIPYLVEAFEKVARQTSAVLELIGDGELFEQTRRQVSAAGLEGQVKLHGRMSLEAAAEVISACDVYVVPAIRDCRGLAMLEAMAIGMPVIAANWAGPGQYADASCGILVDLPSREAFVSGLAEAMTRLAENPALRAQLGRGSVARVRTNLLDWDSNVDHVLEILCSVIDVEHRDKD